MSSVHIAGPVAFLASSGSAVYFSQAPAAAASPSGSAAGTNPLLQDIQNDLNIAPWGEDNCFPQNIENQLAYCGIAKSALDWKARALYGQGILPGKITGLDKNGSDIFEPLDPSKYQHVYSFIRRRSNYRFMIEYLQDWVWFGNCFPEMILSKDGSQITHMVHQESCDARYEQMKNGRIKHVYLSKLWGSAANQHPKFDPKKAMRGLKNNPTNYNNIANEFIAKVPCINMYDAVNSLTEIAASLKSKNGLKSAILPVNYPSVNKTYYQVPAWDGARLSGWIEIASKIPSLIRQLYNKAFRIKYHIEIPETYFAQKYTVEGWAKMTQEQQNKARVDLLEEMDKFLSGDEKAFTSFVSFFDIAHHDKKEYGHVKINAIEDKASVEKDLISSSAADIQILTAMQTHPTLFGAGTIGTGTQRSGGSDIREAHLVYTSQLGLERNVLLEPLYLVRDYNKWDPEIEFKFRDVVLTTLDTGSGTQKKVS